MKSFRDLSIPTKHAILAMAVTGLTVLIVGSRFMLDNTAAFREAEERRMRALAELLSLHCAAVLEGGTADPEDFLLSLRTQPAALAATLYDAEGRIVAHYAKDREHAPIDVSFAGTAAKATTPNHDRILIREPVRAHGRMLGTLHVEASLTPFWTRTARVAWGLALVIGISLFVGFVLMLYLHGKISRPLVELAATARRISEDGDYSIRVAWAGRDEIGMLYRAFNYLLNAVQEFQKALEDSRDQLEDRVQERTARLREEVFSRKETQLELIRAKDQAEAASRAKSMFLANMSHEIRTPLNVILGFSDLLKAELGRDGRESWTEHIEMIQASGRHLLDLIHDLLDLSKIEMGQMEVDRVECSPHEIIAQVLSGCRIAASEKHLALRYRWIGDIPDKILTDPARFRQLLVNLVGNAVKFTEFGSVSVVAELKRNGPPRLVVQVIDSGIGIPEDKQRMIFEPFTQADGSVTREFGGTGLGLSISKWIALKLGGDLTVDGAPGEGSTFTVTIDPGPMEHARFFHAMNEMTRPAVELDRGGDADFDSFTFPEDTRILVVEDGSSNRKLLALILTNAGAEVITAENGEVGLEKAVSESFDLILMDMQMPVLDGYAATPRIREAGVTAPVIALTAHAMKGDRRKCLDAGCDGYIPKPIDTRSLLETIFKTLGIPRKNHAAEPESVKEHQMAESKLYSELPTFDPEFREIVADFVDKLRQRLALMRAAMAAHDAESLWRNAHWVKGSGGTAGFPVFTSSAARLCQMAREEDWRRAELALAEIEEYASRIEIHADVIPGPRARPVVQEKVAK